jgi:glycosyltransferase involved in cell wall biosynthesis
MKYPKITIVTPSFNQADYLESTILSVIGQHYPNLEYIIIDGGSTDNSVEIIKKYEKHLAYWVSEADNGQSHAINKGFKKASGDILAWINSDDMFLPGAFELMAKNIDSNIGISFGNCIHFKQEKGSLKSWGSDVKKMSMNNLELLDYIIQPSSFWTKEVWSTNGELREDLYYGFDWEWFLRAKKNMIQFFPLVEPLSLYRMHESNKTGTGKVKRQTELLSIYFHYNTSYAALYDKLMNEQLDTGSLSYRITARLLRTLKRDNSYASVLKALRKDNYDSYSKEEITLIKKML